MGYRLTNSLLLNKAATRPIMKPKIRGWPRISSNTASFRSLDNISHSKTAAVGYGPVRTMMATMASTSVRFHYVRPTQSDKTRIATPFENFRHNSADDEADFPNATVRPRLCRSVQCTTVTGRKQNTDLINGDRPTKANRIPNMKHFSLKIRIIPTSRVGPVPP